MEMKKLLVTGAAFVFVAGMGITAAAAGPNLFASGTMKPGSACQHHMSYLQWHVGGHNCVTANAGRFGCQPVTYSAHHAETERCDWTTDTWTGAAVYMDEAGNCHISDGYCMNWSDADGDGVCDLCRNLAYRESSVTSGAGENCHVSDGYCMSWSDADGDGVCDMCRNLVYRENSTGNGEQGSGNAAAQDSGSAAGSQEQNYDGYDSGCYGSGYNGCGSSRQGHHGSGHHGSGHHR